MTDELEQVDVDPVDDAEQPEQVDEPEQQIEQPEPKPVVEWSQSDVDEAKAFGWKSADEWRGEKPPGYIEDPRTYVDRLDNFKPFAKIKDQLAATERSNAEIMRKMESVNKRALEMQRSQYEAKLADISSRQRTAVETADTDTFDALERQRQGIAAPVEEQQQKQQGYSPTVEAYMGSPDGAWLKNPVLAETAGKMVGARPDIMALPERDQIAFAEREIRNMHPQFFEKPNAPQPHQRQKPQRVDGGGLALGAAKRDAFSTLPADAKTTSKRFVSDGLFSDDEKGRKEYADEYNAA